MRVSITTCSMGVALCALQREAARFVSIPGASLLYPR